MEDEEDIFVGDQVTCLMKIVHKNLLPEGMSVEEAMKGGVDEESESEEEKKEKENGMSDKVALSAEELSELSDSEMKLDKDVVYSKRYEMEERMKNRFPYRIHEHWIIVLSDREDKSALDAMVLTSSEVFTEVRQFPIIPNKEGLTIFHLHFFCPAYIGLDFTIPVSMRVKPESQKPKIEINKKDLELDKEKGLMDVWMSERNND